MKKRFAVIGYPLGHTMSPFIHKRMFELSHIDASYEALPTPPEKLEKTVSLLKGYDGFNITIPHKESLIPFVDVMTETATLYGAVNTVLNKNGSLYGFSTDADGFVAALELENIPLKGKVLILGSGGVSRTIATECAKRGCEVTFAVRQSSYEKAKVIVTDLDTRFGCKADCIFFSDIEGEYDLLVNGTPVGMYPKVNESPITAEQLKGIKYVFDSIYNPEDTLLIKTARETGIKAVSGMGMLVMQAAKAQEHWLGASFSPSDMKQLIADANIEMRRLFNE